MDVRTLCLGLLTAGPATGYEIRKALAEGVLARVAGASFGAIYPALGRLTDDGMVSVRTEPLDGRPDKKIYAITAKGQQALKAMFAQPLPPDRIWSPQLFALALARQLPPGRPTELIEERAADCRRMLAGLSEYTAEPRSPGEQLVAGLARAVLEAELRFLSDHKHDLDKAAAAAGAVS